MQPTPTITLVVEFRPNWPGHEQYDRTFFNYFDNEEKSETVENPKRDIHNIYTNCVILNMIDSTCNYIVTFLKFNM